VYRVADLMCYGQTLFVRFVKQLTSLQQIECLQQLHDKLHNESLTNSQQFNNQQQLYIKSTTIQQIKLMESEHNKIVSRSDGKCPKMTKKLFPWQRPLRDRNLILQQSSMPVALPPEEKTVKISHILFEQIEGLVQTGSSFGTQGHPRSLRMVPFDRRQNFLYFLPTELYAYLASL